MATSYLDADASGGGDGSLLTPWNSLTVAETNKASWDVLKIKRGTVENLLDSGVESRFSFFGNSDKTVTTYFNADGSDDISQPKPIFDFYHESVTGDWTEVDPTDPTSAGPGSNLWILDGGRSSFNPINGVWFGSGFIPGQFRVEYWTGGTFTITDVIPANAPAQDYQYDWLQGHATLGNNSLVVYSVGNPVTYYGGVQWAAKSYDKVFAILNSDRIRIENLHFRYVGLCADVNNSVNSTTKEDALFKNCTFNRCGSGVSLKGAIATDRYTLNTIIELCDFTGIIDEAVAIWGGSQSTVIRNNSFTAIGLGTSTGAVYGFESIQSAGFKHLVHGNTFDDIKHGRYWDVDGGCVETDAGCNEFYIFENRMTASQVAWLDNSGEENYFHTNNIDDCGRIAKVTDSTSNNSNIAHINNNTATNIRVDDHYNDGTQTPLAAIEYRNMTVSAGSEILNNIITGNVAGILRYDAQAGNINEDNNCFYDFDDDIVDENGNAETIGSNSLSTDPLTNTDGALTEASPCVGTGTKWWSNTRPVGYNGEPFPDWDIDIGANQSLFSPFHPVNL